MRLPDRPSRLAVLLLALCAPAAPGCRRAPAPAPVPAAQAATAQAATAQAAPAQAATAREAPAQDVPQVALTAVVEPDAVPPGGTVTVAWRLAATPGWHFYWDGRNDSGFAPRQKLFLPEGWTAGPLQWPLPERLVSPGDILDHVYHDEVVLLQQVTAPKGAAAGRASLRSDWQWLACRDVCVPGRDSLAVAVTIDPRANAATSSPTPALAAARARLPQPLPPGLVTTAWDGAALRIERKGGAAGSRLTFMPAVDCADLADLLNDGEGESLVLHLAPSGRGGARVRGLLVVHDPGAAARAYSLDVPAIRTEPQTNGG